MFLTIFAVIAVAVGITVVLCAISGVSNLD